MKHFARHRRSFVRGVVAEVSAAAGKIICMSSVHEVIPWGGHVNYASSKGGVMQLMKSLAQEVAPKKIRVNSIAPGAIRTPINRSAWETPEGEAALLKLSADNYDDVLALARLALDIRGYGEVKLDALRGVLPRWRTLESGLGLATLNLELPAGDGAASALPATH